MKWLAFAFAAAVSALLCLASAAIWVHTYFASARLIFYSGATPVDGFRSYEMGSSRGQIGWLARIDRKAMSSLGRAVHSPMLQLFDPISTAPVDSTGLLGFSYTHTPIKESSGGGYTLRVTETFRVNFALWLPTLITAILPAIWLLRYFRSRKPLPGHCRVCGYDLQATPDRCRNAEPRIAQRVLQLQMEVRMRFDITSEITQFDLCTASRPRE